MRKLLHGPNLRHGSGMRGSGGGFGFEKGTSTSITKFQHALRCVWLYLVFVCVIWVSIGSIGRIGSIGSSRSRGGGGGGGGDSISISCSCSCSCR